MSDIADRYDRLAADFAATIAAVPADRWGASVALRGLDRPRPRRRTWSTTTPCSSGSSAATWARSRPSADDPAAAFAAARAVVLGPPPRPRGGGRHASRAPSSGP